MKGKRKFLSLAVLTLSIAVVYQTYTVLKLKSQIEMVNPTVSRSIQYGLVQLEIEIKYQQQHGWESAELLIVRIRNIIDAIGITVETGQYVGSLSDSDRTTLWALHQYLYEYTQNKATHGLTVSEVDKMNFERLGAKLRNNGWGDGIGFSLDWDDFMQRANNLLSKSE